MTANITAIRENASRSCWCGERATTGVGCAWADGAGKGSAAIAGPAATGFCVFVSLSKGSSASEGVEGDLIDSEGVRVMSQDEISCKGHKN